MGGAPETVVRGAAAAACTFCTCTAEHHCALGLVCSQLHVQPTHSLVTCQANAPWQHLDAAAHAQHCTKLCAAAAPCTRGGHHSTAWVHVWDMATGSGTAAYVSKLCAARASHRRGRGTRHTHAHAHTHCSLYVVWGLPATPAADACPAVAPPRHSMLASARCERAVLSATPAGDSWCRCPARGGAVGSTTLLPVLPAEGLGMAWCCTRCKHTHRARHAPHSVRTTRAPQHVMHQPTASGGLCSAPRDAPPPHTHARARVACKAHHAAQKGWLSPAAPCRAPGWPWSPLCARQTRAAASC
jgi:hypothetical protein